MDSGTTTTSLESVLSLVVLRSTKKIKATASSAEFAVLVFTSQLYSSQTFLFSDVNQSSSNSKGHKNSTFLPNQKFFRRNDPDSKRICLSEKKFQGLGAL